VTDLWLRILTARRSRATCASYDGASVTEEESEEEYGYGYDYDARKRAGTESVPEAVET